MTATGIGHITSISLLTPGSFRDEQPYDGLEATLRLFEHAEREGWNGAWIRQRHLEHAVGSAAVFLAAAGQRTSRIELGTAVIPIGWESPFRLAEDLSLADVLSRGRLQVGFSAGLPHADILGPLVYDGDWRSYDLGHGRIERLVANLRAGYLGDEEAVFHAPGSVQRPRLHPRADGLDQRLWYGTGSLASAAWAGALGLNLLSNNILFGQHEYTDVYEFQERLLDTFEEAAATSERGSDGRRVAIGRVVVPFDSATPEQIAYYRQYAASRVERTKAPQGERGVLIASDVVGTTEQILEQLAADPVVARTTELRFELPYDFPTEYYDQLLHDLRHNLAPQLGWRPADVPVGA